MLTRLAFLTNYYLERDVAGRTFYKHPDDIFIVAYPGSGGQWLRRLIANLLDPSHPVTDANIMSRLPDLYHVSRQALARMARPRVIFSHECFDGEYSKIIYLVRDPRDVAVSLFEQQRHGGSIENALSLEQFVPLFLSKTDDYQGGWAEDFSASIKANRGFAYRSRLKDEFLGTPASWGENVMSWIGARGRDPNSMLMLRYEDLLANTQSELARVSKFLNLTGLNKDASPDRIRLALEASRSSAMPPEPGAWRHALPEKAVQSIESTWGPVMTAMGYAVQADAVGEFR